MKFISIVLFNMFFVTSFAYGQSTRLECSENINFNNQINDLYSLFKLHLEEKSIATNSDSYFFFLLGKGERHYACSSLILPSKNKTTIYQLSEFGYSVREFYNVSLEKQTIINFINTNKKEKTDVLPNEYYIIVSIKPDGVDFCESILGSPNGLPFTDKYLIDFKKILERITIRD